MSKNRCTGSTELSSLHNVLLRIMRFVPTSTSVACYCVQDSRCVCFFFVSMREQLLRGIKEYIARGTVSYDSR